MREYVDLDTRDPYVGLIEETCFSCGTCSGIPANRITRCPDCGNFNRPCSGCIDEDHDCDWTRERGCWRFPFPSPVPIGDLDENGQCIEKTPKTLTLGRACRLLAEDDSNSSWHEIVGEIFGTEMRTGSTVEDAVMDCVERLISDLIDTADTYTDDYTEQGQLLRDIAEALREEYYGS